LEKKGFCIRKWLNKHHAITLLNTDTINRQV